MLDFHKAKPLKRLAAYVIDLFLLLIVTAGVVAGMFSVLNFNGYRNELLSYYEEYGQQYDVDLSEQKANLSEEDQKKYDDAIAGLNSDERALSALANIVKITWLSMAVGLLVAYVILEIMLPLIFKNGQTVGKKTMGLCVMHKDHVQVSALQVIFRTILGKYFIETLIPATMLLLKLSATLGTTASLVLSLIAMTQGFIVLMSQANCGIHDKLFKTVVADMNKQHIFATVDDLKAYEEEMARREAAYGAE